MKNTEKAGTFGLGMLWFGAAVSISEILTGALLAPLGFARGLLAILIGHAVGCGILLGAIYQDFFWKIWILPFFCFKCYPAFGLDCCHDYQWRKSYGCCYAISP